MMPILVKSDDVRSGRKAKALHGRLRAAQEAIEVLHGSHVAWQEQKISFPMGKEVLSYAKYFHCSCHATWLPCKNLYRNTKENCKSLKLDKCNVVSVGTAAIKPYLPICLVGSVWFARYCGKMYSHHLFSYGGLALKVGS